MNHELLGKAYHQSNEDLRILVADDEPLNLKIIGEILKRDGLQFIFATDGQEALQAAREEQPTLILLDIMMPAYDGITVCKMLKAEPLTAEIPIIFLTAKSENKDIIEGFAVGGVDYVTKPFFQEEFLARVHTHIQLAQMRKQLSELNQKKTELLTTLAHDVKNPAGAIHSLTKIIMDELDTKCCDLPEARSFLRLMNSSAQGIVDLVEGTLEEERTGKNSSLIGKDGPVDAVEVTMHLIELNSVHAREKSIALGYEGTPVAKIDISRRILTEMFDNLINNAVKYSRPNTQITVRILNTQKNSNALHFEVIDCAELVKPQDHARLFKKFEHGKKQAISIGSSHGVGLSIVKRLVEMHNGEIGVRNRADNQGNIFFIELPHLPKTSN